MSALPQVNPYLVTGTQKQPAPWFVGKGLEMGEQGLYHLPRDHAWHSGPTYFCDDFNEWHYFTFLGKDKKTGHNVSLFSVIIWQGWVAPLNRPNILQMFAWHDKDTGEFIGSTVVPSGKLESDGSTGDEFGFKYSVKDPDEKGFFTSYDYAQERWNFKSFATPKSQLIGGKPYSMDVTGFVKVPGYVPMAYWGLESIGYNPKFDQNPETMYGLTYYYTAPQMEMTGQVTLDDGVHEIEGLAWFEHQWGNFQNTEQCRYFWGYARFDSGDAITWRQYYGNPAGKLDPDAIYDLSAEQKGWKDPHYGVDRFAFIPKGQAPEYSFGPSFVFTPIKWWKSPKSGVDFPWWGELKTPKGTFYLSPTYPEQETITPMGAFIEGALLLRKDSIDGPVVAQGFCELMQLPAHGVSLIRSLPERTDLQFNGGLKRK